MGFMASRFSMTLSDPGTVIVHKADGSGTYPSQTFNDVTTAAVYAATFFDREQMRPLIKRVELVWHGHVIQSWVAKPGVH